MAEEQKWQEATNHVLCANNCGFFGRPTTLNLCSKCYKDHCLKERHISTAKFAVENTFTQPQLESETAVTESVESETTVTESSSSSSAGLFVSVLPDWSISMAADAEPAAGKPRPHRCGVVQAAHGANLLLLQLSGLYGF